MGRTNGREPYDDGDMISLAGPPDEELLDQLQRYRRLSAKRCRVIASERAAAVLPEGPLWVSGTADGQLWFLVARGGGLSLCNGDGRLIEDVPLLNELAASIGGEELLIAGELHLGSEAGRLCEPELRAVLADGGPAEELRFRAFDLVEEGSIDGLSLPYGKRFERLVDLLGRGRVVETAVVDREEVSRLYREWVLADRHESLMVRSERGPVYKLRPESRLDLVVVAFSARIIGDTHELCEMVVALLDERGHYQIVGSVDSGFSEDDRRAWHRRLSGMVVESAHRLVGRDGTLCRFVKPAVVVEVGCADLRTLANDGGPVRRMRLAYDERGYRPLGDHPTALMLQPRFVRSRDDRPADIAHVGLEQLLSRVTPEPGPVIGLDDRLPAAAILERRVWVKETKGRTSVRKYLAVQTNKLPEQGFSPYALFCTDFSPTRAEPLKTSIGVATNRAALDERIAAWTAANIKRGWSEV